MPRHDEGFFSAKDNLRLFWQSELPDEPRAHVAVLHGYAEHFGRYQRLARALVAEGLAVHGFDFRGHGQSDGRRGHIESVDDYLEDLELFWNRVRSAAGSKPCFLFGHSTGALVAALFMARRPPGVAGLVLSAPYLKLALTPPWAKVIAGRALARVLPAIALKTELTVAHLTSDEEEQRKVARDPLYFHIFTPGWFVQVERAQRQIWKIAPTIQVPSFVLCGSEDPVASTPEGRRFFEALGAADKKYKEYQGMRHEPLNERGRAEVERDISTWISTHL